MLDWTCNAGGQLAEEAGPSAVVAADGRPSTAKQWPGKAVHWRPPNVQTSAPQQLGPAMELGGDSDDSLDSGNSCLKFSKIYHIPRQYFAHIAMSVLSAAQA